MRYSKQNSTPMIGSSHKNTRPFTDHSVGLAPFSTSTTFADAKRVYKRLSKYEKTSKVRKRLSTYLNSKFLDIQEMLEQADSPHEVQSELSWFRRFTQGLSTLKFLNPECQLEALKVSSEVSGFYIEFLSN